MPPNFHTYLARARNAPGVTGVIGKVVNFGLTTGDRLLGRSAATWRGRAEGANRIITGRPGKYPALVGSNRYVNKIKGIADSEARKSRNTRLAVGGAVAGGLAIKKYNASQQPVYYDNSPDYSA